MTTTPHFFTLPAQHEDDFQIDDTEVAAEHFEREGDGEAPAVCDFVRKLYSLLEDEALSAIVCWGPHGDSLVFKDIRRFSLEILPSVFRYANFNSFVRQLNKYDFHKMKYDDDGGLGENSWQFQHRHFHRGDLKALVRIRRKAPGAGRGSRSTGTGAGADDPDAARVVEGVRAQLVHIAEQQDTLSAQLQGMERDYAGVLDGMVGLQRRFVQRQDTLWQLMQFAMALHGGGALQPR